MPFRAGEVALAATLTWMLAGCMGGKNEAPTTMPTRTTSRPVIGVFSQDVDTVTRSGDIDPEVKAKLQSYDYLIPASYVTWLGQAGARTLPILLDQPVEYYREVFELTNGVLFPGGNQGIDPKDIYTEEGAILWNLAKDAHDAGDYYPIWGTCLGFEELAVLEAGDSSVISPDVVATNLPLPLELTSAASESRLFRSFSPELVDALRSENITFNSHEHGLLATAYEANEALGRFFDVLSYNSAPSGTVFVSTIEARDYPFYGTQWHPEKNNWEWSQNASYSNIPHSPNAVLASLATARFFVNEARRSGHVFPEEERGRLIYSATLLHTSKRDWTYEQSYVFCDPASPTCGP